MSKQDAAISRRTFVGGVGAGLAAFTIVPSHVLGGSSGVPPSEQVNIAGIGVGERGNVDLPQAARAEPANVVALCDVDYGLDSTQKMVEKFPDADRFVDYRRMLDIMGDDIDGVVIATPDHAHSHPARLAMKMGKHVYLEKPLAHTIGEVHQLIEESKKQDVVTQMGNQGHSTHDTALARDWILDGALGEVSEAWGSLGAGVGIEAYHEVPDVGAIPSSLHYQLWLNRVPYEPYRPKFHPNDWRGWCHFGAGNVGDECCHMLDVMYYALEPQVHGATVEVDVSDTWPVEESYPHDQTITYHFPSSRSGSGFRLRLFVGRDAPRPAALEEGRSVPGGGMVLQGDEGTMMYGHWGSDPQLLPQERMQEVGRPPERSPRLPDDQDHWTSWVNAIRGETRALSTFEYGGGLTEIVLLAELALRSQDGKITWDAKELKTDDPVANRYVHPPEPRKGWEL